MTSPKADLSEEKEEDFNHQQLVPQFGVRIPCYRADANDRLSAVIGRHVSFFGWADHLQNAYYDQRGMPEWTLEDDGREPPRYPNAWRNPLAPLKAGIPGEARRLTPFAARPVRAINPGTPTAPSRRNSNGSISITRCSGRRSCTSFDLLSGRGNDVLVILGPFNEHMIADDQKAAYSSQLRETIANRLMTGWIARWSFRTTLPSDQYADASHPLSGGICDVGAENRGRWRVQTLVGETAGSLTPMYDCDFDISSTTLATFSAASG